MKILLKKKYVTMLTDVALAFLVAAVAAICFIPSGSLPAAKTSPYYCGERSGNRISLMFNVYEGEEVVYGILDTLESYGVKATFFMGGCFADDHAELLCDIVRAGHEIGNHGYFHLDHDKISEEKNYEEIDNTGRVITALCGYRPTLFAPPSGAFNSSTLSAAEKLGYTVVMWTRDTIDWRDGDEDLIFSRATKNAEAGDLVLMHPKKHTLAVLPRVLEYYKAQGLVQSTVSSTLLGE